MAKEKDYVHFSTLSDKLQHLIEVHGNKKTRHFSAYEVELLNLAIKRLRLNEGRKIKGNDSDRELQVNYQEQKDKEKIIILLEQGMSNTVISQVMGLSKNKVSKLKKDYIFSLFKKKGNSAKKISAKFRIRYSIARDWRRTALGLDNSKGKKSTKSKASRKSNRKKKRPKYSAKFQREAMRLIEEGHTGLEVSKILGVNKDTIRKWRKKHGLAGKVNTLPIALQNDVLDLIRDGKSNSEISKITGVSSTTVANWKEKFEKEGF